MTASRLPPFAAPFLWGEGVPRHEASSSAAWVAACGPDPVVLTNAPLAAALAGARAWSAAGVAASRDAAPATLAVGPPSGHPVLLPLDDACNGAGSPYRIRAPATRVSRAPLADAAARAGAWGSRASAVSATLIQGGERVCGGGGRGAHAAKRGPLAAAAASSLDWAWLSSCASEAGWGPPLALQLTLAGARGAVLPARASGADALIAPVAGAARALLVPPRDFLARAYPYPVSHPAHGASMVDWGAPDLAAWPAFALLSCRVAHLTPGDALRVTAGWGLHVELPPDGAGGATVLLTATLGRGDGPRSRGALELQAALSAEARLGDAFNSPVRVRDALGALGGGGDVRTWLVALALPSLSSPDGAAAAAAAAAADALADAAALLEVGSGRGRAGAAALARTLRARRHRPTPWLECPAADPVAAADVLMLCVDERTDEERAYPSLFRAACEAKVAARRPLAPERARVAAGGTRAIEGRGA